MIQPRISSNSLPLGEAGQLRMGRLRNGAAFLSVICAILWPLSWLIPATFNLVTGGPRAPGPQLPNLVAFFCELGFSILPPVGIIAGVVGLYRALRSADLRSTRPWAVVGLVLSCMWFWGIFILSFAGVQLLNWVTHYL